MDNALTVYIDFKSPYAYLAVEPTRRLARDLGIEIDWRPFVLDIPSYLGSARLGKSGEVAAASRSKEQWSGVKYAYYDCRRYANLRGMTIRGTVKIWDTNLAAIGMLWAADQSDEILQYYIDGIYAPFWNRELDVESVEVVQQVLQDAGASVSGFKDFALEDGAERNRLLQESAFEQGIFGVPTYVLGEDIYFGREHLPRIRWQLEGEPGPAPDVAYELMPGDRIERASARKLDVGICLQDPESYLAIEQIISMAVEFDVTLNWYALPQKKPDRQPQAGDSSRGVRHRRLRRENRQRDRDRYLGRKLAEGFSAGLTTSLLEQHGVSLQQVGAPVAWGGAGYVSSPVFSLDEEVFVGRQHLPLLRARLH
jgi:2-hydroxychromene-2-carboxylate isomerase